MSGDIKYLHRKEIDTNKWNDCIDKADNGLIYAKSYYLDAMAENWSAIILRDYEAVMPLPYKRKFGINYVCMPPFVQQSGIFSKTQIEPQAIDALLMKAKENFKFGEYNFNYKNEHLSFTQKNNYTLPLKDGHFLISRNYKTNLKNNLAKAKQNNLHYSSSVDAETAIRLFQKLYNTRGLAISKNDYKNFEINSSLLLQKKEMIIRQVTNIKNLELSIAICLKDHRRIYFVLPATTAEGRKLKANHFLIDNLVKEFAGQNLLLDFEGSDIEGIANFYRNFGSINQPYYFHRWNNLPWPISWIKDKL